MSQDGSGAPNPFSREGSSPDDALGPRPDPSGTAGPPADAPQAYPTGPVTPPRVPEWPTYRDDTLSNPSSWPGDPAAPTQDYRPAPEPPPYAPADVPSYPTLGAVPADPTNPYAPSGATYAPSPYAAGYGLSSPYGVAPQHPQAVTALVLGLVGLVVCQPVGIGGIVVGLRVRRDSDAQPGQFSGRGMGTAGLVLGIVSIVVMVFWIVLFAGLIASDY